ncbi:MAG TPA: hypothetical protein VMZ74_00785 [Ramlibacter sp.]|nr:hypothetical protein [Ramlibacter sp.]
MQPLPPGSAVSYGDGYRLNFDTPAVEGGNSISAQSRDIAGGADAALQAAQSQPNAQGIDAAPSQASTSDIVRQSMDGGASSMFLVRGVETGLQIRNGAMLALWIENLNAMNRLLELLVSF